MIIAQSVTGGSLGLILLLATSVGAYAASRAAVAALAGGNAAWPGRRAVAYWIPVAVVSLVAAVAGRSDVAVAVVFASSVTVLALVSGIIAFLIPIERGGERWGRAWPFVTVAALIAFLAGFSGHLDATHAAALLLEGLVVAFLWSDGPAVPADEQIPLAFVPRPVRPRVAWPELILGIAVAGFTGWAALRGLEHLTRDLRVFPTATLGTVLLGPVLALPLIGMGTSLAQEDRQSVAMNAHVGFVLLNLCLLLPMIVAIWYVRGALQLMASPPEGLEGVTFAQALREHVEPMFYPVTIWRLDTVVLIILGLLLWPVSLGRWPLSRAEGIALIIAFGMYLLLAGGLGVRWG